MSGTNIEIKITGANLADPAIQSLISGLKQAGSVADATSAKLKSASSAVSSASITDSAGAWRALAVDLQTASDKASAAKSAFQEAVRAVGGDQALAHSMFPQLAEQAQQAERELQQLQAQARQTVGVVEQVGSAAEKSSSGFLHMASSIGNVVTGAYFGVQTLASFASTAGHAVVGLLEMNASLEQTSVAFTQLLGSSGAANQLMDQLRQMAAATPFEFSQLSTAAEKLVGVGVAAKDVVPYMTAIGDAVSAFGGSAAEIDRVTLAITQMASIGKIDGQDMLQLTQANIPAWQALAAATGLTTGQLQDMSQKGLLPAAQYLPLLIQGMEQLYGGQMQAQAGTFNGIWSSIVDNIKQAVVQIDQPIFERVKQGLQSFLQYTQTADFSAKVQEWTDKATQFADKVSTFVQTDGPQLASELQSIADSGAKMALAMNTAGTELSRLVGPIRELHDAQAKLFDIPVAGDWFKFVFGNPLERLDEANKALDTLGRSVGTAAQAVKPATELWDAYWKAVDGPSNKASYDLGIGQASEQVIDYKENLIALSQQQLYNAGIAKQHADALYATNQAYEVVTTAVRDYGHEESAVAIGVAQQQALMAQSGRDTIALAAAWGVAQRALSDLSGTYQIGLTIQSTYNAQASEYAGEAQNISTALDIIHDKQAKGIALTQQEQYILDNSTTALARYAGGQQDASETAAVYAINNSKLMQAQDEVSRQYPNLVAGSQAYNDQLKQAFINAGGSAEAFDEMEASGGGLQAAIAGPGGLTEAVLKLIAALKDAGNQHPEPSVDVKITGKDDLDAIATQLKALDGHTYTSNYTLDIGLTGSGGGGQNPGGGGTITAPPPLIPPDVSGGGPQRYAQSIGQGAFGGAVITPAMVQSARQQTSNATSYANEIKALVQALADAAAVMGDGVTAAKDYADAAKTVLDVYSAAVDLNDKMGATVYTFGDQQAANIAALKFLTEKAVNSLGDSAALWSSDGLAHVKEYADAAKSSLDVISQALQFVKDMGQTVVLYGGWQDQNIANLKFIAEKAVTSIADSANIMNGPYIAGVKSYADAAQGALATLSAALQLVKDLGDTVVLYGALQDTNLANLKFIAEKAVTSLADSAAVANGPAVAAAKDYADSAGAVLGVMSDALQLVKDLGDTVVNYGDYQRTALSNLKFIAEWATRAIADSAAVMQGPYLAGVKDYADAVGAAIGAEKDALDLLQALADDTALSSINMRQVAMNARTLAGDARLAVDAFGAAAAGYAAVDPSITALSGDVSTSISALKDTVDFLSTLSSWTDDAHVSGRYVIDSARALGGDARMIADAFDAAAAGYGTEVNASVKALSDDVQSTLGALSDTLDFMGKLADFKPPSQADIAAFASTIAADTVLFVQDLQTASKDMNTDAVKAAGEWADGAGKVLTLMGTTADALVKINAVGRITAAQMQIFHDDVSQVFQLIPQLWTDVQPFIDDAANLQPVLEQIAADMQAAQSAVNGLNVGGGGGGGGSSSGGSGGGGGGGFTPGGALGAKHGGAYGQQIGVLGPSGVPGYGRPDPQPLNVHVHMQIAQHEFEQVVTTTLDGIDRRRF